MNFIEYVRTANAPLAAPMNGFPGVELNGTTIADNLRDGALQARTLTLLNRAVDFDIIFPMMDLTVETEALGGTVDWESDEMPTIHGVSIETVDQAEAMTVPEIGDGNRLGVYVESCRHLRAEFPEKKLWAYALGPFSIAGRLMGMTEVSIAIKLEPETVHAVLRKANELLKNYIDALLDTGADGVMVLEPASGMLREDDANEFSNAYISELVSLIKSRGKTPSLHNCGDIGHLVESLCATGIEALHVGSVSDPFEIYPRIPEDVVLMGNIDPTNVLRYGSPEDVRKAVCRLMDRMADCERFVVSSGCDIPPGTPVENMRAFDGAVRRGECISANTV